MGRQSVFSIVQLSVRLRLATSVLFIDIIWDKALFAALIRVRFTSE